VLEEKHATDIQATAKSDRVIDNTNIEHTALPAVLRQNAGLEVWYEKAKCLGV